MNNKLNTERPCLCQSGKLTVRVKPTHCCICRMLNYVLKNACHYIVIKPQITMGDVIVTVWNYIIKVATKRSKFASVKNNQVIYFISKNRKGPGICKYRQIKLNWYKECAGGDNETKMSKVKTLLRISRVPISAFRRFSLVFPFSPKEIKKHQFI